MILHGFDNEIASGKNIVDARWKVNNSEQGVMNIIEKPMVATHFDQLSHPVVWFH